MVAPGSRLPSVRELMREHRAAPATVQRAVAGLAAEGLIVARPGRGTFVAERAPGAAEPPDLEWQAVALGEQRVGAEPLHELLAIAPPGVVPLSGGYPSADLQATGPAGAAAARAARRPDAWGKVPVEGLEPLRAWFARELGSPSAREVTVCPGAQAALATAFRALARPGDPVLVESPTYLGALVAARAAGLRVVPVPTDAHGVRPDLLATAFAASGARLAYFQPLYANPHGATLAAERRPAVLAAAAEAGAFLIEDDAFRDLALEPAPPRPLAAEDRDGHVVYVRSLTKAVAPGLRIAALAARGPAGERLRSDRIVEDLFVSGVLQEAALELLVSPAWRRHRRAVAAELRRRRDALAAALRERLPELALAPLPEGGLHLWARLPDGVNDVALAAEAWRQGVLVSAGRPYFGAEPPGPFLRLTYGMAGAADLAEGVRRLAHALAAVLR